MKSMKASMKRSMKMKSAMKGMRRMKKAMRVSKIARGRMAKSQVLKGRKAKTVGGLKASDLTRNKNGKVVSKKASANAKQSAWIKAVGAARKALGVKGFCAVGGKSAQGKALLTKARAFYKK